MAYLTLINFFRLFGLINILVLMGSEPYRIGCSFTDDATIFLWLLLAVSFTKELLGMVTARVSVPSFIQTFINGLTAIAVSCASSVAFIFPRFYFMEMNYQDRSQLRFGLYIKRIWSESELAAYLEQLCIGHDIPLSVKEQILKESSTCDSIRKNFNAAKEAIREQMANIDVATVVDTSWSAWFSNNAGAIVAVSAIVIAVTVLAIGVVYFVRVPVPEDPAGLKRSITNNSEQIEAIQIQQAEFNARLERSDKGLFWEADMRRALQDEVEVLKAQDNERMIPVRAEALREQAAQEVQERLSALEQAIPALNETTAVGKATIVVIPELSAKVDRMSAVVNALARGKHCWSFARPDGSSVKVNIAKIVETSLNTDQRLNIALQGITALYMLDADSLASLHRTWPTLKDQESRLRGMNCLNGCLKVGTKLIQEDLDIRSTDLVEKKKK